jgi:hypothetical protein
MHLSSCGISAYIAFTIFRVKEMGEIGKTHSCTSNSCTHYAKRRHAPLLHVILLLSIHPENDDCSAF